MASGFTTLTDEHLIHSNLWSRQLKTLLEDELCAQRFVKVISDFPHGTTFNIPSIGEAEVADFAEGQALRYNKLDTGNYTFSFDKYQYSGHSISEKFKRDSYYAQEVISAFVPRQHRALMVAVETRIWERMNSGQTASALNTINGGDHRFVASGTSEAITLADFARAKYALTKANVPLNGLVAVLDPSVVYTLETQANLTNLLSPNPQWQNIVSSNAVSGMMFRYNIYGFDCYVSNYLPRDIAETVDGRSVTVGVANFMFSVGADDVKPVIGGFRQMPTVHSKFEMDLQETRYATIAEYGFKVYRPESYVTVLTDTNVVV